MRTSGLFQPIHPIKRFAAAREGNVALISGLCFVPLVIFLGVAVDYSRAVQFRRMLQNAVDAASLAGASEYVSSSSGSTAVSVATNYMDKTIANLAPGSSGTFSVTPGTEQKNGDTYATVKVDVAANLPATLMRLALRNMNVSTSATAAMECSASGCGSSAGSSTSSWGGASSGSTSSSGSASSSGSSSTSSSGSPNGGSSPGSGGSFGDGGGSWSDGGSGSGGHGGDGGGYGGGYGGSDGSGGGGYGGGGGGYGGGGSGSSAGSSGGGGYGGGGGGYGGGGGSGSSGGGSGSGGGGSGSSGGGGSVVLTQ